MAKRRGRIPKGLARDEVRERALQIIRKEPAGIRYQELVKRIRAENPATPENTIRATIWDLDKRYPDKVSKPSRGLFVWIGGSRGATAKVGPRAAGGRYDESRFYEPFADWLRENDEVRVAAVLGGKALVRKWGTPDVIGVYKPLPAERFKFPQEIVSAEVKEATQDPVVAFGQAVAYRLFSMKSLVVVPTTIAKEDFDRLEALALLLGIGVVTFNPDPNKPEFEFQVRPQAFSPDVFYVNEFANRLHKHDEAKFNELFS
jgi:hypothetical protein